MEDTDSQPELRRRLVRKLAVKLTPAQLIQQMERSQRDFMNVMSPEGRHHFLRRNFRKRAVRRDDAAPELIQLESIHPSTN